MILYYRCKKRYDIFLTGTIKTFLLKKCRPINHLSVRPRKRYTPIPRVLSKYAKYELNEEIFTMVDFI